MVKVMKEVFEDTKMVIRIRGSKKNRQYNGHNKKVQKDKHGESCGDIDCEFLIKENQCINQPNYMNI